MKSEYQFWVLDESGKPTIITTTTYELSTRIKEYYSNILNQKTGVVYKCPLFENFEDFINSNPLKSKKEMVRNSMCSMS